MFAFGPDYIKNTTRSIIALMYITETWLPKWIWSINNIYINYCLMIFRHVIEYFMAVFNHLSFLSIWICQRHNEISCALCHHTLLNMTQQLDAATLSHALHGAMLWALLKELEPSVSKILLGYSSSCPKSQPAWQHMQVRTQDVQG